MKIKNIFFFIIFFLPFVYSLVVNVKVPLKTYEMLFVLFLLFWFMRGAVAGEMKLRIDRAFYPLFFFFLWVVFTVIISYIGLLSFESMPNWSATRGSFLLNPVIEIFYLLLNIILAVFVSNLIVSKASLKNIYGIMIFSSVLVCLYGLQLFLGALLKVPTLVLPTMSEKPPVSIFFIPRVTATFKEPNFFAGYMTALIPIGLAFFFAPKTKIRSFLNKKAIVILILGLQLLTLILSMSTGGVISFLASSGFFFSLLFLKFKNKRAKLLVFIGALLVASYLFIQAVGLGDAFNQVVFEKLFGGEISSVTHSRDERLEQINGALTLFAQNPVFGIGLSNFGLYFDQVLGISYGFEASANNIYVELLAETGLVGLILFAWFFIVLFKKFFQAYRKAGSNEEAILLIGSWSSLVAILTTWNFFPSYSMSFFWVMFGVFVGYLNKLEKGEEIDENRL